MVFTISIIIVINSFNVASYNLESNSFEIRLFNGQKEQDILKEIETTKNKSLEIEQIIGCRYVQYWEHVVDGIQIKNDYILLHKDPNTDEIIEYIKEWRDISVKSLNSNFLDFQPENIFWKEKIVFPEKKDIGYFYTITENHDYPITCWEVRHTDGTTILYNPEGQIIGHGIPAPYEEGFTMSGDCDDGYGDCWVYWRENAYNWFSKWCSSIVTIGLPTIEEISTYIQDENTTSFFEIGHSGGRPDRFQNRINSYYWASQLKDDMINRSPMTFAFIASCEAMRDTGPGTLSYEFRKGVTNDTVTVGYIGMAHCYGWSVSLEFQDRMFKNMSQYKTVKESFNEASAYYPTITNCVKCVGDENLSVIYKPDLDCIGLLHWTNISPDSTINDNLAVRNFAKSPSFLNWEVIEWPDWGNWSFTPIKGSNLHPEDDPVHVQITINVPDEKETTFTGEIKIANKDDSNDTCTIPVSLTTNRNKSKLNPVLKSLIIENRNLYSLLNILQ